MKFARKMMLVPAGRQPLELTTMSDLDTAMTNVINSKNLTTLEKINLYSQILKKNLKIEEKFKQIQPNVVPESFNVKTETNVEQIKEEEEVDQNVQKDQEEVYVSPELVPVKLDYASALKSITKSAIKSIPKQTQKALTIKSKEIKKTPRQNIKWDSLEDAPKATRIRRVLNFEHKYPKDKYTNVGETYSPDNVEYDQDGNEYIKTRKRKLKKV